MVIKYLTPHIVGVIGLGAVSAAVMSSSDSSILSASSMFAQNIIKTIVCSKAKDTTIVWVLRVTIVLFGSLACYVAIAADSVYALWYLSSDFVYVILFPHLCCVIYMPFVNAYGILFGFVISFVLRLLLGIPEIKLPSVIPFHGNVPFKTIVMLINFAVTISVSIFVSKFIFNSFIRIYRFDFLHVFNTVSAKTGHNRVTSTHGTRANVTKF
jgi:high affinity choline transporter 7